MPPAVLDLESHQTCRIPGRRGSGRRSHEGLRILLREEGVSFQRLKTWKTSRDPDYAAKRKITVRPLRKIEVSG
jgi:hypothetical protein